MKAWIVDRRSYANLGNRAPWRVDFYEMKPDGSRALRSRSFRKKSDAEEFRTKTENSMREGSYRPAEHAQQTFAALAALYLASKQSNKPSTKSRSERELRTWILPQWGGRPIGSITRLQVEQWVTALAEGTAPHVYAGRSATRTPGPLASNSIKHLLLIVSGAFEYAIRHDWLSKNPAKGVERPIAEERPQRYLNFQEVEELADLAFTVDENPIDRALVMFLAYSGLRIGEACALRVSDVSFATRRALIERTWTEDHGRLILGPPKSGKSRLVPLHGFMLDMLAPLIEGASASDYVFVATRGGHLHPNNWRSRVWRRAVAGTKWEKALTPHDLRHTAASMAIASGADPKVVQTMLGHASAVETMDRYSHLWPDRLDVVTDAVGAARDAALLSGSGKSDAVIMSAS